MGRVYTRRLPRTSSRVEDSLTNDRSAFLKHLNAQLHGPGAEDDVKGGIVEQVVTMRDDLFQRTPSDSVEHKKMYGERGNISCNLDAMVFAGGACQSTRLQETLQKHLKAAPDSQSRSEILATVEHTKFLLPQAPQLCICRGLVLGRLYEINTKPESWIETHFNRLRF